MKKFLILVFASLFLFTGCGNTSYFQSTKLIEETNDSVDTQDNQEKLSEVVPTKIFVQVAGAVNKPGVYELKEGSRVYAALEAAGGLTDSADDTDINQASVLEDGQKIYVYTIDERLEEQALQEEAAIDDGLVDINKASESELTTLPGIGQNKARQIIEYRQANGAFASVDDIKNVSGIGDGIFKQINSLIKV